MQIQNIATVLAAPRKQGRSSKDTKPNQGDERLQSLRFWEPLWNPYNEEPLLTNIWSSSDENRDEETKSDERRRRTELLDMQIL